MRDDRDLFQRSACKLTKDLMAAEQENEVMSVNANLHAGAMKATSEKFERQVGLAAKQMKRAATYRDALSEIEDHIVACGEFGDELDPQDISVLAKEALNA